MRNHSRYLSIAITGTPVRPLAVVLGLVLAAVAAIAAGSGSAAGADDLAAGDRAVVQTPGSCLQLRENPGLGSTPITCVSHGTTVTMAGNTTMNLHGHAWREVEANGDRGWVSTQFIAPEGAATPAPFPGDPSTGGTATITYYFCERGDDPTGWGDGGGFCGAARSGSIVYDGMAACSAENFMQEFRIKGDPLDRVYVCEDTGSAVHGNHRDIWFHNSDDGLEWIKEVGDRAEIDIIADGDPLPSVTPARLGTEATDENSEGNENGDAQPAPEPAPAQPAGEFTPEPTPGGLTLAMFDGSFDQYTDEGATLELTSCFATRDGVFIGYTFGAPDFTNVDFLALFEGGLDAELLICRRA